MSDDRARGHDDHDRDDDALSWGGDDDPTLSGGRAARPGFAARPGRASASTPSVPADAERTVLPTGFTAVGAGSEQVETAGEKQPLGNAMLLTLGVLVGVYALWIIGWLIGGLRLQSTGVLLVDPVAYGVGMWLGVLAPAIWFVTVWVTVTKTWLRLTLLVAGVVLLVPWPFVMMGAMGS